MIEQEMIEFGTLDLESGSLACEPAVAKHQLKGFATVAQVKLRAEFDRKTGRLELGQHAQIGEELPIVGQQRFANVKPGEMLLFEEQNAFARFGQEGGG
jgi:hypothetical protein